MENKKDNVSVTDVLIDGIKYIPEPKETDKPAGEKDVNYRALVNDKLQDFVTFYDDTLNVKPTNDDNIIYLRSLHADEGCFIKAGRIQEVLRDYAFYGGDEARTLYLKLFPASNWERVYDLLLDLGNEHFIHTGERS